MLYIGELRKLNLCNFLSYKLKKKTTSLKMYLFVKKKEDGIWLTNDVFINDKLIDEYSSSHSLSKILDLLFLSEIYNKYYFKLFIYIRGGGVINQLKAIELAIGRLFLNDFFTGSNNYFKYLPSSFKILDSRKKERKKFSLKKARKASQYHKR